MRMGKRRYKSAHIACMWSLLLALLCSSCYYRPAPSPSRWELTERVCDSLDFAAIRHYTHNFNFLVCADSMRLVLQGPESGVQADTAAACVTVQAGDRLAVADIWVVPADTVDSIWVKVARDQQTMGWMRECDLLEGVIPDDPISQFIHTFSDVHLIYFLVLIGLLTVLYFIYRIRKRRIRMVHFDDIGSCYPTLLCLTLSASATLYASIQMFVPQTWMEFYFHPTLNPFGLPLILGLFVASVWVIVLLGMATVDDVLRQLYPSAAISYLFFLLGMCIVCYLFFSLSTLYYAGYPCLLAYAFWGLWRYYRYGRYRYRCGYCGSKMREKGECPRCGTVNE